jgi:2,4-dienoyl-CoA reductase-like NADH-dependent reductase (Old Yellow Enzyme family)
MNLIKRIAQLRTAVDFRSHLRDLGINLEFDEEILRGNSAPLAQPFPWKNGWIGNHFCVLPMEGWDAHPDGKPSELTRRRWVNFGRSGAKLIWGGEAVAVNPAARANPNQLLLNAENAKAIAGLRMDLIAAHALHSSTHDLLVGLQLTHSGRFCRPDEPKRLKPQILYPHPLLNPRFGLPMDFPVLSDGEIGDIIAETVRAAILAQQAGFDFVDIKHCHGYLGHEFLSAVTRPGPYGGSLENRTRYLQEIVAGIRRDAPGLEIGVRLSVFDFIPFRPGFEGVGEPLGYEGTYPYAFGGDGSGTGIDLSEPKQYLTLLQDLDIRLVNITAGSPYYVPHIQRPALFPPSDGYQPPEDPLVGAARLINITAQLKAEFPELIIAGTGYSYLQEWLPHVAQRMVRTGQVDFVGLGRMMLSYPRFCADVLGDKELDRKQICRTFSDCTTAPRNGLVSGCYPLDAFYKTRPEARQLKGLKI